MVDIEDLDSSDDKTAEEEQERLAGMQAEYRDTTQNHRPMPN